MLDEAKRGNCCAEQRGWQALERLGAARIRSPGKDWDFGN
jgi:hypothetical protein